MDHRFSDHREDHEIYGSQNEDQTKDHRGPWRTIEDHRGPERTIENFTIIIFILLKIT